MEQKPDVSTPSAVVTDMRSAWDICAALLGGTRAMRAAGEVYLPRWPAEEKEAYGCRKAVAVLFPAFRRTVETLAAKPFSQPIALSDGMAAEVKSFTDTIDREGRNIDRFAADVMEAALGVGFCGILVDYPTAPAEKMTIAQERAAGLRPYWVMIRASQVLGWKTEGDGAGQVLTQLRLMEEVSEKTDEFHDATIAQVRVLDPNEWRTYRRNEKQDAWLLHEKGPNTIGLIPFVPVYGKRLAMMISEPPLLDLAYLNVAHWQSASDQQTIVHVASVPLLVAKNISSQQDAQGKPVPWTLKVGAGAAVQIDGQNAELRYVEHTGSAIAAGQAQLDRLEDRMRQAGAELLVIGGSGSQTRIEAKADNEVATCALQRITIALEDALNLALEYTAKWINAAQPGTVKLFTDFGALTLEGATADLLLSAASAGKISDETLFAELKRRGIVSPDIGDWKAERERIEAQGPALGALAGNPEPAA